MDRAGVGDDDRARLLAWLGEQLSEERFAQLDRAGHDPNDRIPLARVLIDVPIARSPLSDPNDANNTNVLQALCAEDAALLAPMRDSDPSSLSDLLTNAESYGIREQRRHGPHGASGVVLVGGPGQGKSTITQSLCALHHTALLESHVEQANVAVREAVDSIRAAQGRAEDVREGPALPSPSKTRFPLRIVLPEAAAWLVARGDRGESAVPALVTFSAERAATTLVEPEVLLSVLERLDWLVVLDGLDEVPASEARSKVLTEARRLLDYLREKRPGGLVVATTRPQGYAGELDALCALQTWYLVPLGDEVAKGYARQLIRARYETKRGDRIFTRLSEAAATAATARLLRTPLQITILVALIARIGRAPGERWSLFSEYYRIIYEREMERDLPAAELLRRYRPFIDRIHAQVGLLLQVESEQASGTDATMTTARLRDVMHAVFADQGTEPARRQAIIEELLSAITERLVLLVERRAGHVGFEIRPLQEMMAAWALAQKEALAEERLLRLSRSDAHREVVLFLASKAFADLSDVRDVLVDKVLPALNQDPDEPLAALVLRGSLLAVHILEDGGALSQPKYLTRLLEMALRLLDLPPDRALPRLAKVCLSDSDVAGTTTPILIEAIQRRLEASAGFEEALSAWCLLVAMADLNSAEARSLADREYPKIVPQTFTLIQALQGIGYHASVWVAEAVMSRPEELTPNALVAGLVGATDLRLLRAIRTVHGWIGIALQQPLVWTDEYTIAPEWRALRYSGRDLDQLAALHPKNDELRIVVAGARFLLSPSAESLADTLDFIASTEPTEQALHVTEMLPWPLGACLAAADSADALRELARQARAGELGDREEWTALEERCNYPPGTKRIDLAAWPSTWWPASKDLSGEWLPLGAAGGPWGRRYANEPDEDKSNEKVLNVPLEEQLRTVMEAFRDDRFPRPAARVLASALHLALQWSTNEMRALSLTPNDVRAWCEPLKTLPIEVLEEFCRESSANEGWLDLIDHAGRAAGGVRFSFESASTARFLAQSFERAPHRTGLLRILAYLALRLESFQLDSRLLSASRYVEKEDIDSVFFIRLAQGAVPPDELDSRIRELLGSHSDPNGSISYLDILRVLGRGQLRRLAPVILDSLTRQGWDGRKYILDTCRKLLGLDPTHLDDPAIWDSLQLPMPRPERRTPSDRAPQSPVERRPVVVDSLHLRNFRGVREIQLHPATPHNGDGQWIVLLGKNGAGKTTLLRGLALSLFDIEDPVRRPLPPTAYTAAWRRIGTTADDPSFVHVSLRGNKHGAEVRPRTDLLSPEQLKPVARPPNEMVFAYGVRRRFLVADLKRAVVSELYALVPSLFEEGADLLPIEESLSPLETAWHTDPESGEGRLHVELRAALQSLLRVDKIEQRGQSIWVQSERLGDVPLKELSDGYLTLASWVVDLVMRWWHQAKRWQIEPKGPILSTMTGLVLIDEIDLFLHPDWQRSAIRTLRELLPRMSFVVTTHNPLAILGARAEEIWILERDADGQMRVEQRDEEPFRLTGSDLYDFYFGIESTLPDELGQMLYRYRQIAADPYRSATEDIEARELLAKLRARDMDPGWEPVKLEEVPPLPEDLS